MKKRRDLDRHTSKHRDSSRLPPGIKILVAYTSAIALFYLIYLLFGAQKPVSVFFGLFLTGAVANAVEFISLAVLIALIIGLVKKHYWAFWLALFWFGFGALNAIVSLIRFRSEFDVLRQVLSVSSLIVIVMNGLIAWYVYSEKHYFKIKHLDKETKAKDKFFVYVITAFLIVSFLLLITYGINFYKTTLVSTKEIASEITQAELPELVCSEKQGGEQDLCYLILTIMREGTQPELCENIGSDFYKMTCYRAIQ